MKGRPSLDAVGLEAADDGDGELARVDSPPEGWSAGLRLGPSAPDITPPIKMTTANAPAQMPAAPSRLRHQDRGGLAVLDDGRAGRARDDGFILAVPGMVLPALTRHVERQLASLVPVEASNAYIKPLGRHRAVARAVANGATHWSRSRPGARGASRLSGRRTATPCGID
ncbi:MAG: hypothetical protein ACXWYG_09360 [Aeromicrobium sp.]